MNISVVNYINVLKDLEQLLVVAVFPGRWEKTNTTLAFLDPLWNYSVPLYNLDKQKEYGKPMPWIGMYTASASLVCVIAMVADLVHGLRSRKLWFPCKYFTLNAASLSVIAIAIKIPMDINNSMPGNLDQASKLVSLAFVCTMMANSLPSLASLESKELVANIVASGILVITLVVNVCIQIRTGVVSSPDDKSFGRLTELYRRYSYYIDVSYVHLYNYTAMIYVAMLLLLLIIQTCSGLRILISKRILESKYQRCHEKALEEPELQQPARRLNVEKLKQHVNKYGIMAGTSSPQFMTSKEDLKEPELQQQAGRLNVEKLKQHVNKYGIMAGTSSPQFMTSCLATTSAAGVICVASTFLQIKSLISTLYSEGRFDFDSDYNWSIPVIYITQFIGVLLGTIAPLCRCFATLSLKVSIKWIGDHIKVFKVESYWTRKLSDWKKTHIPFPFRSHKCKVVMEKFKVTILSFLILFQKMVVIACKMTMLIPIFFIFCVLFCINCWEWLKVMFRALGIVMVKNPDQQPQNEDFSQNPEQQPQNEDFSHYIVKLSDDMEPAGRTLKGISKSMNRLIQRAEKKNPKNLICLLEKSKGFEEIEKFARHINQVPPLFPTEYPDCWSLPLISLTTIAISLPNYQNNKVSLLRSVSEGLLYVSHVEETLNATHECVSIQKAAKMLWLEVEVHHKWLDYKLKDYVPQDTARNILEWFREKAENILAWYRDTAKNMVTELEGMDIEASDKSSVYKSLCANSMYRITQTIMLSYQDTSTDERSQEALFERLSLTISGILAACLTNLPQVIAMKCHTSSIEKREASVDKAAQLLGETTQIINNLQKRELPSLNPDEFPFINKWCAYFRDP